MRAGTLSTATQTRALTERAQQAEAAAAREERGREDAETRAAAAERAAAAAAREVEEARREAEVATAEARDARAAAEVRGCGREPVAALLLPPSLALQRGPGLWRWCDNRCRLCHIASSSFSRHLRRRRGRSRTQLRGGWRQQRRRRGLPRRPVARRRRQRTGRARGRTRLMLTASSCARSSMIRAWSWRSWWRGPRGRSRRQSVRRGQRPRWQHCRRATEGDEAGTTICFGSGPVPAVRGIAPVDADDACAACAGMRCRQQSSKARLARQHSTFGARRAVERSRAADADLDRLRGEAAAATKEAEAARAMLAEALGREEELRCGAALD